MLGAGSIAASIAACSAASALEPLRVSDDATRIVTEGGEPFFFLADTAWELFHRTTREEADRYLTDRAEKGFTVVLAVALAELDGLNTPNAYGHKPLVDNDPTRPLTVPGPDNDYWDHVDDVIEMAERRGIRIGLLPTWGDKWNLLWGVGPEVFTPKNAEAYGRWLGGRYRESPVIWVLGGDRSIDEPVHREIINAMARGLEAGHGGEQLMTFHPRGGYDSAPDFHDADWLDFNLCQSGHHRPHTPGYRFVRDNVDRGPRKPTLDGEPCYEDHPHKDSRWDRRQEPGVLLAWFDEADVRRAAYEALLAGACGHTYGDHNLWQMWLPGRQPISVARTPWTAALDHPGARQMGYLRGLFTARPFWQMTEDRGFADVEDPIDPEAPTAAVAQNGAFAVAYLPLGGGVTVRPERLADGRADGRYAATWFNPRQNSAQLIGVFAERAPRRFVAPTSGRNNDWVLVLDALPTGADEAEAARTALPRIGFSHQNLLPVVGP